MNWWKSSVVLVLVFLVKSLSADRVINVTPDNNSTFCPNCPTLQQCIDDHEICFKNYTKLVLLEGNHSIMMMSEKYEGTLQHLHNFTMIGNGTVPSNINVPPDPDVKIVCNGSSGFQFRHSYNLKFKNLAFENCGTQVTQKLPCVHAAVAFFVVTNLAVESVSIKNSAGFGIHADKVYGKVTISHSIFSHNNGSPKFYGGNAHFWYRDCKSYEVNKTTNYIVIKNSWFLNGSSTNDFQDSPNATGLAVMVDCSYIQVQIQNITAESNEASKGGNLAIAFVDRHDNNISTVGISIQDSRIGYGRAYRGGGLTVWSEIVTSNESISCGPDNEDRTILEIINTDFYANFAEKGGGALYLSHYERGTVDCIIRKIMFVNCRFVGNKVHWLGFGAAAVITKYGMLGYIPHPEPQFEVAFRDCGFKKHDFQYNKNEEKPDIPFHGIINALSVGKLVVQNTTFTDNNSTAISLLSSNLVLQGHVLFENNTAYNGGALELCTSSVIIIPNNTNTHIQFINNHALKAGGAIYAQEPCLDTVPACFFQPEFHSGGAKDCKSLNFLMNLTFIDNTAGEAGDAIYNGAIDYCYMYQHHVLEEASNKTYWSSCIFDKIFDVSQQIDLDNTSYISSEPHRVCLCPDYQTQNCSKIEYKYPKVKVFPGERFNISAVVVGQRNGTVPAVIEAYTVNKEKPRHKQRGPTVTIVKSGKYCTNLTVVVRSNVSSNASSVFFKLSVQTQNWKYILYPQVEVTLEKKCPFGFTQYNGSNTCTCDEKLPTRWKLFCNDENFKYKRLEPLWIGCEEDQCLLSICAHNYCNLSILNQEYDLVVEDDMQCNFNRAGHVCGACKLNYSVVLGSSRCLQCSNKLLVPLLVAFAFAGIAMFAFLFIFNFTVTEGTINGLIFYANIVHLNHDVFFPGNRIPPFSVLIAWFNLDLGIETCFFEGMDDYTKLWLQFGFVGYTWLIGGLIIILSRKYIIVTRFFGRNVTKVLATLFLLSFTKVVRSITKIVSFTVVRAATLTLWHLVCEFDGNIIFLAPKHVPLYVLACLLALIFTFFATALTFIQCLQKTSTFKLLRWVEKFRPFFEAFTGPCKNHYRFWPGLLFMCRASVIVISSLFESSPDSLLRVAVITAVSMFLLCLACVTPKGVYKKWLLNILECSFILNLTVTCIALLAFESIDKKLIPFSGIGHQFITNFSVSLVVLTFIGILTFHAYMQLTTSRLVRTCIKLIRQKRQRRKIQAPEPRASPEITPRASADRPSTSIVTMEASIGESTEESIGESTLLLTQSMPPVVNYSQYREPLLADDD